MPSYIFFLFPPFLLAQNCTPQNCAADTARANELFSWGKKLQEASKLDSAALCYEQAAEIWYRACPEVRREKRIRF
jgi:hypothetical protein